MQEMLLLGPLIRQEVPTLLVLFTGMFILFVVFAVAMQLFINASIRRMRNNLPAAYAAADQLLEQRDHSDGLLFYLYQAVHSEDPLTVRLERNAPVLREAENVLQTRLGLELSDLAEMRTNLAERTVP